MRNRGISRAVVAKFCTLSLKGTQPSKSSVEINSLHSLLDDEQGSTLTKEKEKRATQFILYLGRASRVSGGGQAALNQTLDS